VSLANKTRKGMSLANKLTSQRITRKVIKMINTQIVDIKCQCARCETPITKMVLNTRLHEVMLLCYDCHYARLAEIRKAK
jgi:hypothetical protein